MPFDTDAFKSALTAQCSRFNCESCQAWSLGPGVFAASVRQHGERDWTTIFYFDAREVKQRDEGSGTDFMERQVQLIMMVGFTVGRITGYPDDHVRIAYFSDDPVPTDSIELVNWASQLFVKVDNSEIEWPDRATPITLN